METEIWYQSNEFYSILAGGALVVFEWIMRAVPTKRPVKLLLWVVIAILKQLSKGIEKTVEIAPDNVKPAPEAKTKTDPEQEIKTKRKWFQFRKS